MTRTAVELVVKRARNTLETFFRRDDSGP